LKDNIPWYEGIKEMFDEIRAQVHSIDERERILQRQVSDLMGFMRGKEKMERQIHWKVGIAVSIATSIAHLILVLLK